MGYDTAIIPVTLHRGVTVMRCWHVPCCGAAARLLLPSTLLASCVPQRLCRRRCCRRRIPNCHCPLPGEYRHHPHGVGLIRMRVLVLSPVSHLQWRCMSAPLWCSAPPMRTLRVLRSLRSLPVASLSRSLPVRVAAPLLRCSGAFLTYRSALFLLSGIGISEESGHLILRGYERPT